MIGQTICRCKWDWQRLHNTLCFCNSRQDWPGVSESGQHRSNRRGDWLSMCWRRTVLVKAMLEWVKFGQDCVGVGGIDQPSVRVEALVM